jgi:nitroreductase
MDVLEAIAKRKSIRAYKNTPVPEDKLNQVLEAARLAPSGGNRQEMKFVVVKDENTRRKLSDATGGQKHVAEAPVVIAAVAVHPERMMICDVPAYPVDLAIAIDHMTLAAYDVGLGTCWIGAFQQETVRKLLGIPDSCKVVELLTLGIPAEDGRPKTRKSIDEIICFEKYKD